MSNLVGESISVLVGLPRKTGDVVRAALGAGDAVLAIERLVQDIGPVIDSVRADMAAMRETTERLDRRVAEVQQDLAHFNRRLTEIESLATKLARDVDKATDRLPEPQKGPLAKVKEVLSGDSQE